jgi:serine/arginine repetitive matrix protein 1
MRKVELSVMKPWISDKIIELLGFEDEVVVEYVHGLLDDPTSPVIRLFLIIICFVF